MNAIDLLLRLYDDSWYHAFESVQYALEGVTEEEARWQHPSYSAIEPEPGLPTPGSILWHIAHMEHCCRIYAHIFRDRSLSEYPDLPPPEGESVTEHLDLLYKAAEELRLAIADLDETVLSEPCLGKTSTAEFLGNVMRHHTWHAGSIIVARRLYRAR